jgi:quinol monooxygenase YgiN
VPINLAILISTKPGRGTDQLEAFASLAPLVRAEHGCLQYDLHAVEGSPDRFVMLEQWDSADHLTAHDATPHMLEAAIQNAAFRAGPAEVLKLQLVDAP